MDTEQPQKRIAIIGGGPSGLFMYKRITDACNAGYDVSIFEKRDQTGVGMPYSTAGASEEHITNVSGNEIPGIVTSVEDWIKTAPQALLAKYNITPQNFNDYKVLPRLFFGEYLSAQFEMIKAMAHKVGIVTHIYKETPVTDIIYKPQAHEVWIETKGHGILKFDYVIICTGHYWPLKYEGRINGYYNSPYPPAKLNLKLHHPVAIKGSSLTAIDAVRTLARQNGTYHWGSDGKLTYTLAADSAGFKMIMHSKLGLLPALRFHLDNPRLTNKKVLTDEQVTAHIKANDGFLSLDFIFEKDFKELLKQKEPDFYAAIKDMSMETFVDIMLGQREQIDPFELLKAEYQQAEISIERKKSVYWKEALAILSFCMNYPAKHFSAEDMQRLQKVLMPLISVVIAFVPQSSARELMALHNAGVIDLVAVGDDSNITPEPTGGITYTYNDSNNQQHTAYYKTFIDCTGQPHLSYHEFPFKSLLQHKEVSPARLKFKSAEAGKNALAAENEHVQKDSDGNYYLSVPGITINDNFQIIDPHGAANDHIYMMAVPYMAGFNPDYSGLDFCEAASQKIWKSINK